MKHLRHVPCCTALAVLLLACGSTESPAERLEASVKAALDREMAAHPEVRGAAARVHLPSRGILVERSAGEADPAAHVPMTAGTPFRTASITKMMTAAVVMQLVEEGALSLDETLAQLEGVVPLDRLHVAGGVSSGRTITVEQLLRHRSGLADYFFDGPVGDDGLTPYLRELLTGPSVVRTGAELVLWTIENLPPAGPPGTAFHYADTNYVLLGLLVEAVERQPLPQVYRERLFEPLGMTSAFLECCEAAAPERMPAHTYFGDLDITDLCLGEWGGGGVVTTLEDLDRFVLALAEGRLFGSPATLEAMLPADEIEPGFGYGLGILLLRPPGHELWGHDGAIGCFAFYVPGAQAVVVATVNQVATDPSLLLRDLVLAAEEAAR